MIATAAGAGVAAVKIQTHFADDLSPEWADKRDHVKGYELDWKAHEAFYRWCMDYKVLPVTSVYTDRYSAQLKQIGFTTVKLGSAEASNTALANRLILRGFNLWISAGGQEVIHPPERTTILFHAVSKYPHLPCESCLPRILQFQRLFPTIDIGFSSHIDPTAHSWQIPIDLASILGARMIEVHFTLLARDKTKDGPVSLFFDQLQNVCQFDKLTFDEKIKRYVAVGNEERRLIERYSKRWKQ